MYISKLTLKNYRNYSFLDIKFDKTINIIYGFNAQGKTNMLEAIYFLGRGKSHRNKNNETLKWNSSNGTIIGEFSNNFLEDEVKINISNNDNINININKKNISKKSDLYGKFHVVLFNPDDLRMIKEGPSTRRRFIDSEIINIKPSYNNVLKSYNKVLSQRNILLKDIRKQNDQKNSLDIWNEQLIEYGIKIIKTRLEFLKKLNDITKDIHNKITDNKEYIKMFYISNLIKKNSDLTNIVEIYRNLLDTNIQQDIQKGYTTIGPHLDDIKVEINEIDVKIYGSQGQQRTAALTLKLSEIELIKNETNEKPIVLLDDVMSELDVNRQKKIISFLKDIQAFITCTDLNFIKYIQNIDKKIYTIHQGKIIKVQS